jgi:hypothetical protein
MNFISPSSTREDFTTGITERCRKILQPLPLVPKLILNQHQSVPSHESTSSKSVKTTTTAYFNVDGRTLITSVAKETTSNNVRENFISAKSIDLQSPTVVAHANKKPSYLNLACCVNGYSNYTNYDSAERKEINKSREASPIPPFSVSTMQQRSRNDPISTAATSTIINESQISRMSFTKQFNDFNIGEKDVTDNIAKGRSTVEIKKSFVQQRVEKLYGTSDVLTNNASHSTKNHNCEILEKSSNINETPLLPVMKHLRPEFANRLQFISSPKSSPQPKSEIFKLDVEKQSCEDNSKSQSSTKVPEVKNGVANIKDNSFSIIHDDEETRKEAKDGHYFLKLLNEEKARILKIADETEIKLKEKQSEVLFHYNSKSFKFLKKFYLGTFNIV